MNLREDTRNDAIVLERGTATLGGLRAALEHADALQVLPDGAWLLTRNLVVAEKARLTITGAETPRVRLRSDADGFVWMKVLGGQLTIEDTCISSWDASAQAVDTNYDDGRSFILARDGARMDVRRADISYLGYAANESYGLAWRLSGTTGDLLDSRISYNFYGMYTYEVSGMTIRGNEVHHNIRYGIDPHTRSNRLLIEDNIAHHNGKQGIILAEACDDGVIRNNVTYANGIHGIVIYQKSNRAVVEGNTSFDNASQGININDAEGAIVRGNTVYGNGEDGIGVGQNASDTSVQGNTVSGNARDGITVYSAATATLIAENRVERNGRYGIYVKVAGNRVAANDVSGNARRNIEVTDGG